MITNYLYRQPSRRDGTFGIFAMPEFNWCCHSLEQQWINNTPFISCIPIGEYMVRWTKSNTFKRYTYEVTRVSGRSGIRIHPGNWFTDSTGCILFGQKIECINRKKQLVDPWDAVLGFQILMNGNQFKLIIQ
jgi:hypothetical protein